MTTEEKQKVVDELKDKSIKEVAALYGLHPTRISQIFHEVCGKDAKLDRKRLNRPNHNHKPERNKALIADREKGLSFPALGKKYNIHRVTARLIYVRGY